MVIFALYNHWKLILHYITIGNALSIGIAFGIVLVVGDVRPRRQLTRGDQLVHDVTDGGDGDDGYDPPGGGLGSGAVVGVDDVGGVVVGVDDDGGAVVGVDGDVTGG